MDMVEVGDYVEVLSEEMFGVVKKLRPGEALVYIHALNRTWWGTDNLRVTRKGIKKNKAAKQEWAKQVARAYVAKMLKRSDEPGWPFDNELIDPQDNDTAVAFMGELRAIADRIESTINEAAYKKIREKEREHLRSR